MAYYRLPETFPPVVKNLIIANVVVLLAQFVFEQQEIMFLNIYGALWPVQSGLFKIWQLVTHMFMHANFEHLIFNMLGLWVFGRYLENFWGPKRCLEFYAICGIAAGVAHLAIEDAPAIGASGAVMGILVGFAYLFPNTSMMLLFFPVPIKAKYLALGMVAVDLFGGLSPQPGDRVGHWAHLGGAAAGFLLVLFWNKRNRKHFY
jgi:membrane associated rhomboid family serine protease